MTFSRKLALWALVWACGASAVQASPETTVRELSSALLSRDERRILALFDLARGGYVYALDGELRTGPQFEAWLRSDIIARGRVFVIDSLIADGSRVEVDATYGIGTPSSHRRYLFEVIDCKIVAWFIGN